MAATEAKGSNVEPKTDVKKMIRSQGGHNSVFPKSETELLLSRSIVNDKYFCEGETLLGALKSRKYLAHRYLEEIQFFMEDEDDLSGETESHATFDDKAITLIARLDSLINGYRQKNVTWIFELRRCFVNYNW